MALLTTGDDFNKTHKKLKDMMGRKGDAFDWYEGHYSQFELSKLAPMDFSRKPYQESSLTISHPQTNRSATV